MGHLMLAKGLNWADDRDKLDSSDSYIDRWSKLLAVDRLAELFAKHAGRQRFKAIAKVEAKVLAWSTKRKPADGSTHWSSCRWAAELGDVSHMSISRIWAKRRLQPHRPKVYVCFIDPDFRTGAADVIGLRPNSPAHAAMSAWTRRPP